MLQSVLSWACLGGKVCSSVLSWACLGVFLNVYEKDWHYGVRLCALLCLVACADVSGCVGYVCLCELATSYVKLRELLH